MIVIQDLASNLSPVAFAQAALDFTPDAHQTRILKSQDNQVILNCTRQLGKSTICAIKAVFLAYTRPDALILVASPSGRQSAEFVRKASGFLRKLGIRPRGDGDNEISLLLPNNARIVGIPGLEATVRGFSAVSLLIIDEASRVSDELYRALRPMLAIGGGGLWLLSTPYGKRGFFYNEWTNGGPAWTRFEIPATECPRISPAFLEQERRSLGPRYFAQEYLCEFHSTSDALFNESQVRRAVTDICDTGLYTRETFIGVDLGQRRDRTALVAIERAVLTPTRRNPIIYAYDSTTRNAVRHLERLPLDTPYTVVAERVARLADQHAANGPCTVIVDATGVGLPVVDALRIPSARWNLKPVTIGHADRDTYVDGFWRVGKRDLMARLQVGFDFEELTISSNLEENETLIEELTAMRATLRFTGHTKYESPGQIHDDLAVALSLAWWGAQARKTGQLGESKRVI